MSKKVKLMIYVACTLWIAVFAQIIVTKVFVRSERGRYGTYALHHRPHAGDQNSDLAGKERRRDLGCRQGS